MQKNLFGLFLSCKFYFFYFKFIEAKFLNKCFWDNLMVFWADTGNNRKIVDFKFYRPLLHTTGLVVKALDSQSMGPMFKTTR